MDVGGNREDKDAARIFVADKYLARIRWGNATGLFSRQNIYQQLGCN